MKKIDRYILKNFIKASFTSIFAFITISVLTQVSRAVDYVLEGKMDAATSTRWLFSEVPSMIVMLSPLAILLGALITMNKMSKNLEVIALKTSGISFKRIAKYPLIASVFISILIGIFNDTIVVESKSVKRELKYKYLYNLTQAQIGTQIYRKGLENYLYYIRIANGDDYSISNMVLADMTEDMKNIEIIYTVERAYYDIKENKWKAYNIWVNDIEKDTEEFKNKMDLDFFLEKPSDLLKDKFYEDEATIAELREAIIYFQRAGGDVRKLLTIYHDRWAYPTSIIIMAMIGLSLGSRYVRGASAISIAISIILGYAYFVMQSITQAASTGGTLSPISGAWLPNIVYLCGAIYTMYRAEY